MHPQSTRHPAVTRRPSRPAGRAARAVRLLMPCALGLLALPAVARADAQSDYASLFGDEEKKVLQTPTTRDDGAFAAKLLSRAGDLKDAPELRRLVLTRAVELGQKDADGLETAVAAAKDILAGSQGAEKLNWQAKLVDLYTAQYKRATGVKRNEAGAFLLNVLQDEATSLAEQGKYADAARRFKEAQDIARTIRSPRSDAFADAAKEMQAKQQIADKLDRLKQRYEAQGGEVGVLEQLIVGYLVELEAADTAARLAASHPDKNWERALAAAGRPLKDVSQDDLQVLAEWSSGVAEKQPPAMAGPLLARSQLAWRRFLAVHGKKDVAGLKAQESLEKVNRQVSELYPNSATADRLVVVNSHNSSFNDRGATQLNIALLYRGKTVWRRNGVPIDWTPNVDQSLSLDLPQVPFDVVRIEVTAWKGQGVGLSEVQVFAGAENIAQGQRVAANGATEPGLAATNLTDGNASSAVPGRGAWMAPSGAPAWAEIAVKTGKK